VGVAHRICLYTSLFTIRNQDTRKDRSSDQASFEDKSNDQALILAIKILDRRRSWKYRTHSGDYPLIVDGGWSLFIIHVTFGGKHMHR
jgi:hypothetical protein